MHIAPTVRAYLLGVRDGWQQPYDLNTSANVEHLIGDGPSEDRALEAQDLGINLGQYLRAGRHSQAHKHGYRILPRRKRNRPRG